MGTKTVPCALHLFICLNTDPIKLTGGHIQLFSPSQFSVNVSTALEFGQKYLELKRVVLEFKLSANRSIVKRPNRSLILLKVVWSIDQSSVSLNLL